MESSFFDNDPKNEDAAKIKTTKMRMTPKMKITPKMKTAPKNKDALKSEDVKKNLRRPKK